MLKIGTFSKLSRLSIRMLRRYDELGLLQPVHTDPFTGYRYYREEQLTTAGRIAALRDMGFGLSAIGALLEDGGREELDRRLAEQQRALEALLAETRQRLRLLMVCVLPYGHHDPAYLPGEAPGRSRPPLPGTR